MAQRAIREADGKRMMARLLGEYTGGRFRLRNRFISVSARTNIGKLPNRHKWLLKEKLVVKPDQLIKRRGKNELLLLDADWETAEKWLSRRMNGTLTVGKVTGCLDHFIVEPFVPHDEKDEHYLAITSQRGGDEILFFHRGGIDVGDVDARAAKLFVPIGETPLPDDIEKNLLGKVPKDKRPLIARFVEGLFRFYADLHYAYLEINPFVVTDNAVIPLDLAAKLDDTADFLCGGTWGAIEFPAPFGRIPTREEAFIEDLDSKTGASLKLSILNPEGRIWSMVAGGGASVIYADTITDLGFLEEMANYGEYSGNPDRETTYLYARTILECMTRRADPRGKILLIGGGIANFTDVAQTFTGIIQALHEYGEKLREQHVRIFVRRGGPNYKEGLRKMRVLGSELGVPIEVFGPETHMTKIVSMALKEGE